MKSAADGKRFGTTSIAIEKTQFSIQKLLTKWGAEASQWTFMPTGYNLRFRLNNRNYMFAIPLLEDDPQEVRRLFRVIFWYLDTMLAAQDSGLFTPEKVFLAFLEVAPDTTLSSFLDDPTKLTEIRNILGGGQLALEAAHD